MLLELVIPCGSLIQRLMHHAEHSLKISRNNMMSLMHMPIKMLLDFKLQLRYLQRIDSSRVTMKHHFLDIFVECILPYHHFTYLKKDIRRLRSDGLIDQNSALDFFSSLLELNEDHLHFAS